MFSEVNTSARFPELEEQVLAFWQEGDTFKKSLALRTGAPEFVFYEGPPTANGLPGVHHVQARAYKDLFPRYKTMKGFLVQRKAGWDCHGLPVELEVEKRLGFSGKKAIEEYGVEGFNRQCRKSVMEYEGAWRKMTDRIGFWVDMDDAYMTMSNGYVESVWWSLKQLWDKNLVYLGYKVVPYCPRCGTPLSSHEVGLGYRDVVDPSITIRFPLRQPETLGLPERTSFLVWTTTPWTLPGNVAAAIHPTMPYLAVRKKSDETGEVFILAQPLVNRVLGEDTWELVRELTAADLEGVAYTPPFPEVGPRMFGREDAPELPTPASGQVRPPWTVVVGDFVTSEDGTGLVHIAPAFGADDMEMSRRYGLPVLRTVSEEGRMLPEVELFAGEFFKTSDPAIIKHLKAQGILFARTDHKHSYPHCWRCRTALMYYATNSWFIRNTELRERLIEKNREINWVPSHIKEGRYGDWLKNLVDWALSRSRYWGTPLPIWVCEDCGAREMVGSFAELGARSSEKIDVESAEFDPHRPYVDNVTFACQADACSGTMRRVNDVIDCWYDSGSMPFAQFHYPFENQERFRADFPADFICEGLDQTRGWFNSMHQLGVMIFDSIASRTIICHGLVLDEQSEKMSKTRGNVVNPWDVLNTHGADALRWYLYSSAPPEASRCFSVNLVGEAVRHYMLTLWNTYSFFVLYANLDRPDLAHPVPVAERPLIDRWALARLHETIETVTAAMDAFDPTGAARALELFVDDLSNWYVRRNRRRYWRETPGATPEAQAQTDRDKLAAYQTLYECLVTLARLTAPFTPFLAEGMYRNLVLGVSPSSPESVHLCDYPVADASLIDPDLLAHTRATIQVVSLGRAARAASKLKTRQPLPEAVVRPRSASEMEGVRRFQDQVLEELNVKSVRILEVGSDFVTYRLRPHLPAMGKKYGKRIPAIRAALEKADGSAAAVAASEGRPFRVTIEGAEGPETLDLLPAEILIDAQAPEGYASAEEDGRLVALDTHIDRALAMEGLANDLMRNIQDSRKKAAFQVDDRIRIFLVVEGDLLQACEEHRVSIELETLSTLLFEAPPAHLVPIQAEISGHAVLMALERI